MTTSRPDPDRLFPGERERAEAIRDCERIIQILEAKDQAFRRKVKAAELACALGVPLHLHKALETVLYDSSVRRRKMAADLIMGWARHG